MTLGIVLCVILIARFLVAAIKELQAPAAEQGPHRWANLAWMAFAPAAVGLGIALATGAVWTAPLLAAALVGLAPWPFARWVLIPLGLHRAAWLAASVSDWTFRLDKRGGGALAAAWALCRARGRDDAAAAWVEERLRGAPAPVEDPAEAKAALRQASGSFEPLRGAGVAAMAMLAAYRGDREGARALFESVGTFAEGACPPEAHRVAARWLAADAAAHGDWREVADLAEGARGEIWEPSDLGLLGAVAARLLGEAGAPSDVGLWLRWAAAPHRRATLPLVRRALARRDRPRPAAADGPELRAARVREGDLWGRAVALHATLLLRGGGRVTGEELRRLGGAWDAAFEDERATSELHERARIIGGAGQGAGQASPRAAALAPSPEAALGALRRSVVEDLAAMARAARLPHEAWEDLGETLNRANRLLRDELLSELELTCDRLRRRVDEHRELPPADEWREWIALRAQYERAAEMVGMELRRLAFPKVDSDVCHFAVWLFNVRRQRPMANAMFRWLLAEAEALGDERAADLQRKNASCGI